MKQVLEFEKPVIALREKIAELKTFTKESDLDLTEEIVKLETRLEKLENDIYTNLKPWIAYKWHDMPNVRRRLIMLKSFLLIS